MKILLFILAAAVAVFVSGGAALLIVTCSRMKSPDLYNPDVLTKKGYGAIVPRVLEGKKWLEAHERSDLEVISYDGKILHGLLVKNENAVGTVILFHGWRSGWQLDFSCALEMYYKMGLNLIIVDQRAHGKSQGAFTTFGVKESRDVQSWVTYAAQMFGDDEPIFLGGMSMGAATVLMASNTEFEENVRGIIADSGFTSAYEILRSVLLSHWKNAPADFILGWLNIFTRLFAGFDIREKNTVDCTANAVVPILFVHGTGDSFVPCEMSQRAYDACRAKKSMVFVDGAGHGMSFLAEPQRVYAALFHFINSNLK